MKISIVIPSYNGKSLLEVNLPAVMRGAGDSEVIVVDDFSNDGTEEWLGENYPQIKLIRNQKNLRFGQSCNAGVSAAKGGIVVLLNNDVQPEKEFLTPIIEGFEDPNIFAVGCREKNTENGLTIWGGRGVSQFKRGLMIHFRPQDQKSKGSIWLSGGSMAVRKDLWERLGGFDRLFRPAYEEDRDICWQALKGGYKIVFEARSVVSHNHESTNKSVFGERKIRYYSLKNQLLFVWKNVSNRRMLAQHILWLPYHLVATTIRTKGVFLMAFVGALGQLSEALRSRSRAARLWRKNDEDVLRMAK